MRQAGFVLLFISLVCCQAGLARAAGQEFVLFYSNDVQGETEPCGCQPNQLGGLSRKGFQYQKIAEEGTRPRLTLDAGNLLFKTPTLSAGQVDQEKMAARAIAKAYELMGYQAVGIGSYDLAAGPDFLAELAREGGFSWLSANLVDAATAKPLFLPGRMIRVGGIKAFVLGLTGNVALPPATGAKILPWTEVLPPLLAKASREADLLILLSTLSPDDNQRLAETYPAIHLIVHSRAGDSTLPSEPLLVNKTLVVSTTSQGQKIGVMEVNWQGSKRWGDSSKEALAKQRAALDSLLWQLSKVHCEQADQQTTCQRLKDREQTLRQEIERLASGGDGGEGNEPSSYRQRLISMEDALPRQAEIVALIDGLDRDLNRLGQERAKAITPVDSPYLGSESCGRCHAPLLAAWQQTKHATAYQTLVDKKQQFNTACLPCHVTGVGMDKADAALSLPDKRRGVGCESCHGPGRQHAEQPKDNPLPNLPTASVCHQCHTPPHDTTFDYEARRQRVHELR